MSLALARDDAPPNGPIDFERAVLSGGLLDAGTIPVTRGIVRPEHFWRPAHRLIWSAMLTLHERDGASDLIATKNLLLQRGELDDVGGVAYLADLTEAVPRGAQFKERVEAHARNVRQAADLRAVEQLARDLAEAARIGEQTPESLAAWGIEQLKVRESGARPLQFVSDLELLTWPEPTWLAEGRIVAGSLFGIYGAPGSGKSFIALDLALCCALGIPWLGANTSGPVAVGYIAGEGAYGLRKRLEAWRARYDVRAGEAVGRGLHVLGERVDLMDDTSVARVTAAARSLGLQLLVVDTLARCFVGDENSSEDVGRFVAACDRIREEAQLAICVVHHSNKNGTAERGSTALRAAVDTWIACAMEDDVITLSCEKQKDGPPFEDLELRLVQAGPSCVVELRSAVPAPTRLSRAQVSGLNALERFAAEGATRKEWETASQLSLRTFQRVVKELLDRRYVQADGKCFRVLRSAPEGGSW